MGQSTWTSRRASSPNFCGDPVRHDVHGELRDALSVFLGEEEEVGQFLGMRHLTSVDAVGVGDHPALLRLTEDVRETHAGDGVGLQRVTQDLPRAHTGQLIHVADQQQMRARARWP